MSPLPSLRALLDAVDNSARLLVVEDLDLDIRIGVFEAEKTAPQRMRITAELLVLPEHPDHGDRIDRVLSYAEIHDAIAALAGRPHIALQETLADDVARICLAPREVAAVEVFVRKLDVYADCRSVGVRIVRCKPRTG